MLKLSSCNSLFILLYSLSLLGVSSCVTTQQIKIETDTSKVKKIYTYNDTMSADLAFVPGSNKAVINRHEDALVIDYINNKTMAKLPSPAVDYSIEDIVVSSQNKNLLLATKNAAQLWDLQTLKPLISLKSKAYSRINALSIDSNLLIFDKRLIDTSNNKLLMEFSHDTAPFEYSFSNEGKYLVIDGHMSGISIINIEDRKQLNTLFEDGVKQIEFSSNDNHLFYAGYGSKLLVNLGGYYSSSIGLYDINKLKRVENYTPSSRISCWVKLPDNRILASLVDGSLQLLNAQLEVKKSWQTGDKVSSCIAGNDNNVWLASQTTGVYVFNVNSGKLDRVIETINDPARLVLSENNKHLGIVKQMRDGAAVSIYSIRLK